MRKLFESKALTTITAVLFLTAGCQQITESSFTSKAQTNQKENVNLKMMPTVAPSPSAMPTTTPSETAAEKTSPPVNTGAETKTVTVLDLREAANFDEPEMAAEAKAAVISAVYGKTEKEVAVSSMVNGAFTKSGVSETAYLLQPGGRKAIDPKSLEETVLAVFEGNKLVGKFPAKNYNAFLPPTDIDGDGKNELLLTGNNYQMGTSTMWAQLVAVDGGKLNVIKDFKTISVDSCDTEGASREIRVAEIKTTATTPPRFEVQFYRGECPTNPEGNRYPNTFKPIPDKEIGN